MSAPHDDFAVEPIRGLPEKPPVGETILWQGAPDWRIVARTVFHVRAIGAYFAILALWNVGFWLGEGRAPAEIAAGLAVTAVAASLTIGFFALWAYAIGRTTVYTLTSHRVVMRHGVALPVTLNLPFVAIEEASLRSHTNGAGDIVLKLSDRQHVAYFALWPNARPWRIAHPEPMLRAVPDAGRAASLLARAIAAKAPVRIGSAALAEAPSGAASTAGWRPATGDAGA